MRLKPRILLCFLSALLVCASAGAGEGQIVGSITAVTSGGSAPFVLQRQGAALTGATVGTALEAGDFIITNSSALVTLALADDTRVAIGPSSKFAIQTVVGKQDSNRTLVQLAYGLARLLVKKVYSEKQLFQVNAGNASMGVRGTSFVVDVEQALTTSLYTLEGSVVFAKTAAELAPGKLNVLVAADYTSLLNGSLTRPLTPAKFSREALRARLEKRAPGLGRQLLELDLAAGAGAGASGGVAGEISDETLIKTVLDSNDHRNSETEYDSAELKTYRIDGPDSYAIVLSEEFLKQLRRAPAAVYCAEGRLIPVDAPGGFSPGKYTNSCGLEHGPVPDKFALDRIDKSATRWIQADTAETASFNFYLNVDRTKARWTSLTSLACHFRNRAPGNDITFGDVRKVCGPANIKFTRAGL